ncbi:MAG: hypothetical protein LBC02_00860 [Planctomycetaceae bacterium]|nr:hypothetical protein [Planctomycetaceae bacterium]
MKDSYTKLSEQVSRIDNDPILQYANNINKNNNLTNEIVQQISPIFKLHLLNNEIPYSDPFQRTDYIRGYMSAWRNAIISDILDTEQLLTHQPNGKIQSKELDSMESNKKPISDANVISSCSSYSISDNNSSNQIYNEGWIAGTKQVSKVYDRIITEFNNVNKKYSEQVLTRTDILEIIKKPDVQDRLSEIPSLQAFIIIQKILKTERPIENSSNEQTQNQKIKDTN